jgi:hypothetical protein
MLYWSVKQIPYINSLYTSCRQDKRRRANGQRSSIAWRSSGTPVSQGKDLGAQFCHFVPLDRDLKGISVVFDFLTRSVGSSIRFHPQEHDPSPIPFEMGSGQQPDKCSSRVHLFFPMGRGERLERIRFGNTAHAADDMFSCLSLYVSPLRDRVSTQKSPIYGMIACRWLTVLPKHFKTA